MYELKYSLTDADVRAVNKKNLLPYFVLYFAAALIGLVVGIVAVVMSPRTSVLVLGIIILVFAGLLLVISALMLIAPKQGLQSAIAQGDEHTVTVDKTGITVDGEHRAAFMDITKVRMYGAYLAAFAAENTVYILKNAFVSAGSMAELFEYMSARCGRILLESATDNNDSDDNNIEG